MVKKIAMGLGFIIPVLGMVFSQRGLPQEKEWMILALWILLNLVLLQTALPMTEKMLKILGLKNLDFPKTNLFVYMVTNYLFILLLQIYFMQVYVKDLGSLVQVLDVRLLVMVLLIYAVNLQYGRLGDVTSRGKVKNISFPDKKSFISGADRYGAYVGTYEEGLVFGLVALSYESIQRIYRGKNSSIQIQGKAEEDYVVTLEAPKVQEKFLEVLKEEKPQEILRDRIRI